MDNSIQKKTWYNSRTTVAHTLISNGGKYLYLVPFVSDEVGPPDADFSVRVLRTGTFPVDQEDVHVWLTYDDAEHFDRLRKYIWILAEL